MRHDIYTMPEVVFVSGQSNTFHWHLFTMAHVPFKNVAAVDLEPRDTLGLHGKYIYQITIKDIDGEAEIPNQGFLLITHNINESFLR